MSAQKILLALVEQLRPWRGKIQNFLTWWEAELRACLPIKIANVFADKRPSYLVRIYEGDYHVFGPNGEIKLEEGAAQPQIKNSLSSDALIEVDDPLLLIKSVQLPSVALSNLDEIIAFQYKQHFPLNPKLLSLGFRVSKREAGQNFAELTLAAVRTDVIEERLSAVRKLGFEPVKVDSIRSAVAIKVASIARTLNSRKLFAASFVAVLVGLLTVLPFFDAARVRSANKELQGELKLLTEKTQASLNLKKTLDQRIAESKFLRAEIDGDVLLSAIDFLSKESPADVWLSELQYDGKAFRLSGVGSDPAGWVLKLQSNPAVQVARLENVAATSGEEQRGRFQIRLEMKPPSSGDVP